MNKKELFDKYEALEYVPDCIVIYIHMPTGETETITNPNVVQKLEYIEKTYDDSLIHQNCKDIYITNVFFCEPCEEFEFGGAIDMLKDGEKVARKGWNGKNMYLYYVPANAYPPNTNIAKKEFDGNDVPYSAYIAMKTVQGNVVPWLASQTDVLANDWYIVQ